MFFPIFILSSNTLHLHASPNFLLIKSFYSRISVIHCACHPGQLIARIVLPTQLRERESKEATRK